MCPVERWVSGAMAPVEMWVPAVALFNTCCLNFGKSIIGREGDDSNRRDICAFYCCGMFPFLARLADSDGIVVPRGMRKLKALHTLGIVNIAHGKAILQEIKRLTRLRKLAVTGINKKNCQEFCSTLVHLSSLESLLVDSREEGGLHGCLDGLRSPPKTLRSLKLRGALIKLPEWVAHLQNLVKLRLEWTKLTEVDGTVEMLGNLPNLANLRLLNWSFLTEQRHLTFHRGAFPSLTTLELGMGHLFGITSVEFEERTAAPRLELLTCSVHRPSLSGLSSLPSLKEVLIVDKDRRYSKQLVEDVRAQLTRNPNNHKPVLKYIV
ncbi:disease resistance protein PIK6-NP-like [Panicum virgatum]|uniref:disease resistance protein PIK6-NP-like n=1 Tax=Panicum virgatum TaxID=38727 RepID=UPI0019D4FAED|nr:disease resistance protein PIK6-NP-like [Panicum virgatum]